MNKLIKTLIFLASTGVFLILFAMPAKADTILQVDFNGGGPSAKLFDEANFLPGDAVTREFSVKNVSADPVPLFVKLENYNDLDNLGGQFNVIISEKGSATSTFEGSMIALNTISYVMLDPAFPPNTPTDYEVSVTFLADSGNSFQGKMLGFDFAVQTGDYPPLNTCGDGIVDSDEQCDAGANNGLCPSACSTACTFNECGGGGGGGGGGGSGGVAGTFISGQKFNDFNLNGYKDVGDVGLPGWIIYLDLNGNKLLDTGEPYAITDAQGNYSFSNVSPGIMHIREVGQSNWTQTFPGLGQDFEHVVTVAAGNTYANMDFGNSLARIGGAFNNIPSSGSNPPLVLGAAAGLPKTGIPPVAWLYLVLASLAGGMFLARKREPKL